MDGTPNEKSGQRFSEYIQHFNILKPIPYDSKNIHDVQHGPAFELFLTFVQKSFKLVDARNEILMRHLCTFLLFYFSVLIFYRLNQLYFKDRGIALLGCVFLVLHPRIFSHSFYNSADISFLSFYIMSTYTLFKYLSKRSVVRASWHALACALLTDIRISGCLIAIITVFVFSFELFKLRKDASQFQNAVVSFIIFICLYLELIILFYPVLWVCPAERFLMALRASTPYARTILGWYYNPIWIMVTTPPLYLLFFIIGLFFSLGSFFCKDFSTTDHRMRTLIILVLLFIPLAAPMLLKTFLFCEWRHHYFIYPMMVIIALIGVKGCLDLIDARVKGRILGVVRGVFIGFIGACLTAIVWTMVVLHPYQHIYFNFLKDIPSVERLCIYRAMRSNPDYWRLSVQDALMMVLERDNRPVIRINVERRYASLIPEAVRKRLRFGKKPQEADYWIQIESPPKGDAFREFCSVVVDGRKVRTVYKKVSG